MGNCVYDGGCRFIVFVGFIRKFDQYVEVDIDVIFLQLFECLNILQGCDVFVYDFEYMIGKVFDFWLDLVDFGIF